MVDAHAGVGDVLLVRADPAGQHAGGALHAVAQAAAHHLGEASLHGAAQHGHGVGVVQVDGVRAVTVDVRRDVHDGVDRAQVAEDAARAARVAHVGVHAVFLGNQDVVLPDVHLAVQDGGHDAVRAHERFLAVQGGDDLGRILALGHDALHGAADVVQALGVDVHQRDGRVAEGREGQQVSDQRAGKAEAARADKGDFLGHGGSSFNKDRFLATDRRTGCGR